MELIADLVWQCWILPALLIVAWALLWWRGTRRVRLWFAALTPAGAVATFILGLVMIQSGDDTSGSRPCTGPVPCTADDGARWAQSLASISDLALLITINAVLALVIAVPLAVLTVIVELAKKARDRRRPEPHLTVK